MAFGYLMAFLSLVVMTNGASICNGRSCNSDILQEHDQQGSHLSVLSEMPNLEVDPPIDERDPSLESNSKIVPWPQATVPYAIWGSDKTKSTVRTSLKKIEESSCVRFVEREGQARYLLIKEGTGGCWTSSMGFPSSYDKVTINLGSGCVHGKQIKHEVYHALGFPHEQSRPDRTEHVSIKWENIKNGATSQYSIKENFPTLEVPYDLKSIMHYGKKDFAKDPTKPTMVPTPWVDGRLGGDGLSWRDVRKLNVFYQCDDYLID